MSTCKLYDTEYCHVRSLQAGSFSSTAQVATKPSDQKKYVLKALAHKNIELNEQEINILRDLIGIPGIVQYVEHFTTSTNELVVVYDYCDGFELFDHLETHGPVSETSAKKIFTQLCIALDTAHKRGIVHRDIKPENIIIDNDGNVTIIDWGLAFYPDKTTERICCGTPSYACPEIITIDAQYTGPEVDVWSLGCVLYTLFTASMPFDGKDIPELFDNIRSCNIIYRKTIPDQVVDILKRIFVCKDRITLPEILKTEWLDSAHGWYF